MSSGFAPRVGGVEKHVARLGAELARRSHDVEVLTQETDDSIPRVEEIDGVTVRRFAVPLPINAYEVSPKLWSWLATHGRRYDVIHAHNYHATPALAAVRGRQPLVFTPHYHGTGHSVLRRVLHPVYRPVGRRLFERSAAVICVSQPEAELVARDFPSVSSRIRVVPNGVDAPQGIVLPYPSSTPVVLSVGRLERYKRVDVLAQAMTMVPDAQLVIIGDGPESAVLPASDSVHVIGRVGDDELRRWYRTATVVASLSSQESFGLTIVEGLNGGARIVASSIPAHENLAASYPSSIDLVDDAADPTAVAVALRRAIDKGRARRPALTSWSAVADETLEVYWAALNR